MDDERSGALIRILRKLGGGGGRGGAAASGPENLGTKGSPKTRPPELGEGRPAARREGRAAVDAESDEVRAQPRRSAAVDAEGDEIQRENRRPAAVGSETDDVQARTRRPAAVDAEGEDVQPRVRDRKQAVKHAVVLALSLAAIALTVRAILGQQGLLDAHRSTGELATLRSEVETWRGRNAYLEARVKALREDPATIEKIARERLGWVRPGEITFLFPHDPAIGEPGDPGPVPPGEFAPTQPGDVIEPTEPAPAPPATTPAPERH